MNRFNMTRYAVTHPIGIVMIVLFFVTITAWVWSFTLKSIRPMWW